MIHHTVAFRLHDAADDEAFWSRVDALSALAGVGDFRVLQQIGTKNEFTHALSMYFESQTDYDAYNDHPDHAVFVNEVWLPNVADFIELDYVDAST